MLAVMPNGSIAMTKSLVLWFLYSAVVGFFAACVPSRALPVGAPQARVFQLVGVTAFVGYSAALWYRRAWGTMSRATFDGLIYALLTAGIFGWLWLR